MGLFSSLFGNPWHQYLIKLAFSAARVDGAVNEKEQTAILNIAKALTDGKVKSWQDGLIQDGMKAHLEPEQDSHMLMERTQQAFQFWFYAVYWMFSVMQADGSINNAEGNWLERLRAATLPGLDWNPLAVLFPYFAGRSNGMDHNSEWAKILGVPPGATKETITRAYRAKANEFHPDKLAGVSQGVRMLAEAQMKQINDAYHRLTNGEVVYDAFDSLRFLSMKSTWLMLKEVNEGDITVCSMCYQQNRLPIREKLKIARCGSCHMYLGLDDEQVDLVHRVTGRQFKIPQTPASTSVPPPIPH